MLFLFIKVPNLDRIIKIKNEFFWNNFDTNFERFFLNWKLLKPKTIK